MIAPQKKTEKKPQKRKGNPVVARLAIWGLLLMVACVAAWLFLPSSKDEKLQTAKPKKTSAAKTTPRPVRQEAVDEPTNAVPQIEVKRYGRSSNVPTDNTNNIHYASMSGIKVVDAEGNEHEVRSTPIFKSRADNMLWAAVRPGGMPSGLNALRSRMRFQTGSDEAFLAAIRNMDITIEEDDPPHVVNAKNMTLEIKREIVAALDGGRSFDDIYREISDSTRKERMYERIAQEDMRKIIKERDAEAARRYVEDVNPVMREMGLKELRLPSWAEKSQEAE